MSPDKSNVDYLFSSQRLGFRNWLPRDIGPYVRLSADAEVMRYFPKTKTREESEALIERSILKIEQTGLGLFAVDRLDTTSFIGFIGFSEIQYEAFFTPCTEIGWRLAKEHWNLGFATEGAKACLKRARDKHKLEEVFSLTSTLNEPSENVMKKIGMQSVGEFDHPKVPDGHELRRHVVYKKSLIPLESDLKSH